VHFTLEQNLILKRLGVLATFRRKIHFPEVARRKDAKAPEKMTPPGIGGVI
jgi:hypothetical protein